MYHSGHIWRSTGELDITRCRVTAVSIGFAFVANDTLRPLRSHELDGGRPDYPGNDMTSIEGESAWVRIDGVRAEYHQKVDGSQARRV